MKRIIALLLLISTVTYGVDFIVRQIDVTADISYNSELPDIEFYKGEAVRFNLAIKRGRTAVEIPLDSYPVWRVWIDGSPGSLTIGPITGSVVNANLGTVRCSLTPTESDVSNRTYETSVQLYDSAGSDMAVIYRGDLVVKYAH